jgi:hypothetical protein
MDPVYPPEGYDPDDDPMKDVRPRVNAETWTKPYLAPWPDWLPEALGCTTNGNGKKKPRARKKAEANGEVRADVVVTAPSAPETVAAPEAATTPGAADADGPIPEGRRNTTLTSLAGHMRKAGLGEDAIRAALLAENAARCSPPLSAEEVEVIARSVARYEPDPYANIIFRNVTPAGGTLTTTAGGNGAAGNDATTASDTMAIIRIPASQLVAAQPTEDWVWENLLARGGIGLLSAWPKCGKTTLLAHILKARGQGGSLCGRKVMAGKVVIVTEEGQGLWASRRDRLGLADHCEFILDPFPQKPSVNQWLAFINGLQASLSRDPADFLVCDTLANLWPVRDENNASEVLSALKPLRTLTEDGKRNVLLVHHLRKSDGEGGTGSRGSGALAGFVDSIIELRRHEAGGGRHRVLKAHGRHHDTPAELVIELSEDGKEYRVTGTGAESRLESVITTISEILPLTAPGMTRLEIVKEWPEDTVPRKERLLEALAHGVTVNFWHRDGRGVKGDPHRYYRTPPPA